MMRSEKIKKPDYKIIGISGTFGSGKDTLGHLLEDRYNYKFISVTDSLREEAVNRNLQPNRLNLQTISAEWRRESGLGVLIDKALEQYEPYKSDHVGVAIASLRNPGEVDEVHRLGGSVVWVDADPEIRYARVQFSNRNRAAEDDKTFEEFVAEEQYEMSHAGDEATLNMGGVKDKADVAIFNNSTELDHFLRTIEGSLSNILGK